ncbi:MAG: Spy/CpxP family protein refolding chaperone [Acidobacteriia bacterium]|nr:Spy/CpxP family protein refolding chaperone [Terriglobia bacterium]
MRHGFFAKIAVVTLAAGTVLAQAPPANAPEPGAPATLARRGRAGLRLGRIARALNLTSQQRQQARAIFGQARQSAQPLRQQMQQNRLALRQAALSGGDIQQLATEQGNLSGQLVAIRTQAWVQFYNLLTPGQRVQAAQWN